MAAQVTARTSQEKFASEKAIAFPKYPSEGLPKSPTLHAQERTNLVLSFLKLLSMLTTLICTANSMQHGTRNGANI
eukprot:1158147-Pelagomonas_calceolata.AAC.1